MKPYNVIDEIVFGEEAIIVNYVAFGPRQGTSQSVRKYCTLEDGEIEIIGENIKNTLRDRRAHSKVHR